MKRHLPFRHVIAIIATTFQQLCPSSVGFLSAVIPKIRRLPLEHWKHSQYLQRPLRERRYHFVNNAETTARAEITGNITLGETILLAKTTESFKLSDLYRLETNIKSHIRHWAPSKILSRDDRTGSLLLRLDPRFAAVDDETNDKSTIPKTHERSDDSLPASQCHHLHLDNFDWLAECLAFGTSAPDLIVAIQQQSHVNSSSILPSPSDVVTLDYTCLTRLTDEKKKTKNYTSQTLLCRVAQCLLPATVALEPSSAGLPRRQLLIIDTYEGIYLAEKQKYRPQQEGNGPHRDDNDDDATERPWRHRPFQYSSAVNINVASIIINVLLDLTMAIKSRHRQCQNPRSIPKVRMLDPTCGSGTFLALGLLLSSSRNRDDGATTVTVVGYDVNEKCVEGTLDNLIYLFGEAFVRERARVVVHDSSLPIRRGGDDGNNDGDDGLFDCAVTNLPWGQNTSTRQDNREIIKQVYNALHYGGHCAIISKCTLDQAELEGIGFDVIETASIPPKDFTLPRSRKGRRERPSNLGGSDCIVSILVKRDNENDTL